MATAGSCTNLPTAARAGISSSLPPSRCRLKKTAPVSDGMAPARRQPHASVSRRAPRVRKVGRRSVVCREARRLQAVDRLSPKSASPSILRKSALPESQRLDGSYGSCSITRGSGDLLLASLDGRDPAGRGTITHVRVILTHPARVDTKSVRSRFVVFSVAGVQLSAAEFPDNPPRPLETPKARA